MRVRTLVAGFTAGAATLLTVLAPPAQAVSPTGITVGGSGANASYHVTARSPTRPSVVVDTLFGDQFFDCEPDGGGSGFVNGGTTGLSPLPAFEFTDLDLDCSSLFTGAAMSVARNLDVVLTSSGQPATGKLHVTDTTTGTHCINVNAGAGCTFRIGGSADATFDETTIVRGGVRYQQLTISGPGLQVKGPVSIGYYGLIANNNAITLNVTFNIRVDGSTYQAIDVLP